MKLLIIEDNLDIQANLYSFLEPLGFTLDSARNGFAGLSLASEQTYDAILLDLMLPGLDGLEVCRRLRQELCISTPVLMSTARDTLQDKVLGLGCGADDYMVKPFSMLELEARLKALVRRARGDHVTAIIAFGGLRLDPENFEVSRDGMPLELTPSEFKLLTVLLRNAPRTVSREALEQALWGDHPPRSEALRTHIHALRQAIDRPFTHPMLRTVQGVGYRLAEPDAGS
jgi:DNA-binding response OmpR family regulator